MAGVMWIGLRRLAILCRAQLLWAWAIVTLPHVPSLLWRRSRLPLWLLAWVSVELSWCIRLLLWTRSLRVGEGWILIAHVVLNKVGDDITARLYPVPQQEHIDNKVIQLRPLI